MEEHDGFLPQRGNYKSLRAYQVAECIYDITYIFTSRFLKRGDRTIDQMVQAARSGKQNIAEGSMAGTTSKKTEIHLTNVARSSLQELLVDYEDYLRVRNLCIWDAKSDKAIATRNFCRKHNDSAIYREKVSQRSDEAVANIAIVLIHQADYLLRKLIERQKADFLENGGITEQMSRARREYRSDRRYQSNHSDRSNQSDRSDQSDRRYQSNQSNQSDRSDRRYQSNRSDRSDRSDQSDRSNQSNQSNWSEWSNRRDY